MAHNSQQEELYRKRRKHQLHLKGRPLHKRIITRIEEWNKRLLSGLLGALVSPKRAFGPIDPATIKSVLFIRNDAIGDMVLSTPMWRILKQRYPHITIGIVASFRNIAIVENDSDIDQRYDGSDESLTGYLKLARQTRKIQWDVVMPLLYQKRTKFAIVSRLLAPKTYSSMVLRGAQSLQRYGGLYSLAIPTDYDAAKDVMFNLMREHFERTFGIAVSDDEWRPTLKPNPVAIQDATLRLQNLLKLHDADGYIHVNLEANGPFKEFGLQNCLALSKRLIATYSRHLVIWTSSAAGSKAAKEILHESNTPGLHFFDTLTLNDLIAVVKGAALVVTPDTSIVHIAAAEQKPVVGLYAFLPHQWRPVHEPSTVVTPVFGEPVSSIPVASVFAAVTSLFDSLPTPQ